MTNLETVFQTIEALNSDELDQVYRYIQQRRQTTTWTVNNKNIQSIESVLAVVHQETESMTDDEINNLIDDTLSEVRSEQKNN